MPLLRSQSHLQTLNDPVHDSIRKRDDQEEKAERNKNKSAHIPFKVHDHAADPA